MIFVTGSPASFGWAIRRDGVDVRILPGQDRLAADATELHRALAKADAPARAFVAPARRLFDELFGLLLPRLQGSRRVHIVPDGALAFVPLTRCRGRSPPRTRRDQFPFLLRESINSCTPSCTALVAASNPRATNAARRTRSCSPTRSTVGKRRPHIPRPGRSRARGAFDPIASLSARPATRRAPSPIADRRGRALPSSHCGTCRAAAPSTRAASICSSARTRAGRPPAGPARVPGRSSRRCTATSTQVSGSAASS